MCARAGRLIAMGVGHGHRLGVQAEQRLAGGDRVAVLDEPLDDRAAVRGGHRRSSRRLATAPIVRRARARRPRRSAAAEGALGRCHEQPPGRVSVDGDGSPCLSHEVTRGVELVGGLERERLDTLERPLGEPVRVPAGGSSRMPVTPRSRHGLHAEVPAHRVGDLLHDAAYDVAAVVDHLAVAVGDQRACAGRGWRRRGPAGPARATAGRHVLGVEGAGDREREQPGLLGRVVGERCELLERCRRRRPGRAPLTLAGVRPCLSSVASTSSASPPSTAVMPVGVASAASAIARPRSRTSTIACSAVIARAPAAAVSSPTLWPATAPIRPNASAGCGKRASAATRPERDQQRLRDRGVADRVGVGLGAVVREVQTGHGVPSQSRRSAKALVLQPRGEESGRLGTLSGGDDDRARDPSLRSRAARRASGTYETSDPDL